jgi:hypothetical protein
MLPGGDHEQQALVLFQDASPSWREGLARGQKRAQSSTIVDAANRAAMAPLTLWCFS